ncbi:unnamed protein product [Adineta steineri]|uniref:SSD domain-containing protein n=1 Tax=Adineta steineri TaxID=433720 RepID=A0A815VNP6_9BILA|nr:unnamed protein product [Adineta steineri]CAF1537571.1 unnamed protein product [Adineta steineri]
MPFSLNIFYSRLLVRHHWLVLSLIVFCCVSLTAIAFVFTKLPDLSDPRIGWGARGKGTIFSQLMVLRHAAERFRHAYDLPLDENELFGMFEQFFNVTVDDLDENTYRSDVLKKYDIWKKKKSKEDNNELVDYHDLNREFYDNTEDEDYDENSESKSLYQWNRDRHFDVENLITKYVDNKMINITILDFVSNLPQFNKTSYKSTRLSFDLFRPYAYLLEAKYRGQTGRDGMIEFYIERSNINDDLLSLDHLRSICQWEKKFKDILTLNHVQSLSLATFVALYSSKNDCQLITSNDIERFRSILHTCLPYYINGYMDISLSDEFVTLVGMKHQSTDWTYQEQVKAIYTTLRHTCFYKNITRFILDHFVDKNFIYDFQQSKINSKVSKSMIYISNYKIIQYNRTRDQTMCLKRQPYSIKYCQQRGCMNDYQDKMISKLCIDQAPPLGNCEKYCQCKYQCINETEQVILLTPIFKEQELINLYRKYFAGKQLFSTYKNQFIKLIALNFAYVREKAAMVQVYKDTFLSVIAAGLIIIITIVYLRSITIAFMIVLGTTLSLGVSYFIYRVIYGIPIFPTLNFLSIFILIGIGCDDIFVFFDTWDHEKKEWLRKYHDKQQQQIDFETNIPLNDLNTREEIQTTKDEFSNDSLDEEALIEIMSKTLKHGGKSMFVTSFTTTAAFFTNMLTNISFIQVFGVYTGTSILLYFLITITAIAAFAVIYEKHIRNISSCVCFTKTMKTSFIKFCQRFRDYIFNYLMPLIIIKLRYFLVLFFFCLGILGLIGVFYYPKFEAPSTYKVNFFGKNHPMEIYEFGMKPQFNGYIKEYNRFFAYPEISFVFGIRDIDDGYIFDMNDRGHLHLMPIDLHRLVTLDFFKQFIQDLGKRNDLFLSNYDLERDFNAFYQLSKQNSFIDEVKYNLSKTNDLKMINETIRDAIIENNQRSALKEAMQCITGTAGENNIPIEFCQEQLKKQRPYSWTVLLEKPSSIDGSVRPFAIFITIRGNLNNTNYKSYDVYYRKIKDFFDPYIKKYAPIHLKHGWFSSPTFAFYGIQRETVVGSYSSLVVSLGIALLVLFLTSGNLFIAIYALITMTFSINVAIAIFATLKWELGVVEAIILIMSVGLSVDFVVHFGVGYIHADPNRIDRERKKVRNRYLSTATESSSFRLLWKEHEVEREIRVRESISRVGSAVFMAAFTTFAAGFSMIHASLTAYREMGQFLMTIMLTSWFFAMFFFLPLCAILGPVGAYGSIPFTRIALRFKRCIHRN